MAAQQERNESRTQNDHAIPWGEHIGLIISGALTIFLVFKILAVADWDPTTAKGIVSASGTTNVLVGATIVFLPTLYALFVISVLPLIQSRLELKKRTSVERSAARMLETWPLTLMIFIVPLYLVLAIVAMLILSVVTKFVVRRRKVSRPLQPENRISRFEANAVALSAALFLLFGSLANPWLPTESIKSGGGAPQVVYVLSQDDRQIVMLLDKPRRLERRDLEGLTREFCLKPSLWFERTALQLGSTPGYRDCPSS